ncbi:MAG: dihydrodipicolinate synthase family protein [Clostridiales bacterium]|nr:dihydrodipicolinate synthase family protein [Clostridiales bacterium]
MKIDFIKGIIPPILTPIDENEMIDEIKLRKLVNYVIEGGVHGILAFGSNGEFYMIEEDEMERALKIILDEARGRVPVYMGIGAISTRKCMKLANMAENLGATGISVLLPMYINPNKKELYHHFKEIALSVPQMPMLLYNNPGRVGYGIPTDLVVELAGEIENIVGIKDSSGDMTVTSELIRRTQKLNFKVFGGKDTLIFGALVHGAAGAIATTANVFPKLVTSIYNKYMEGDITGALEAQYKLNPIRLSMDKASFPVGSKDLAKIMGIDVGKPYKPNLYSEEPVLQYMKNQIKAAGLLK